jgi:hypothetical protein
MVRLIFLFVLISTLAQANVGEIAEIKGSAALERGKNSISAENGTLVMMLDTAVTSDAKMRIDFIDDTRVDITEHSRLVIDDFVFDPSNNQGSLSLKASMGTIRYASGQIAKKFKQNVKIRTPSATIGVRGTDFIMVVDEIGGSMITLLPSCDVSGSCFVGEISVETDAGMVILNKAFETTQTTHSMKAPSPPLTLDIPEDMLNSLLLLRKKNPYQEEEQEEYIRKKKLADFLGIDFLEFDGLDYDALTESIEGIWVTALDETDFMLADLLYDMLDQLNLALAALFRDELALQNRRMLREEKNIYGFDPTTGITLENESPNWVFKRRDYDEGGYVELRLNQEYGYSIELKQGEFEIYDYRLGDSAGNSITIQQSQ